MIDRPVRFWPRSVRMVILIIEMDCSKRRRDRKGVNILMKTAKQDVVVEHCSRDGDCRNCPGLRDKELL